MKRLPVFLFAALCVLTVSLAWGWWQMYQTRHAIAKQLEINQELVYKNAALQADIADLKNGSDAVQERARTQLGMIKRDEVFVQVMDQPSALQHPDQANAPVTGLSNQPEHKPAGGVTPPRAPNTPNTTTNTKPAP